jgi:PEGA domain-containing protein
MRRSIIALGMVLGASGVGSCRPAETARAPTMSLRLQGSPADATVIVDDDALGTLDFVAAHGVALPPGVHHLTVKAAGYFPWDREITAQAGAPPLKLEVALTPVPD